MGQTNNTDFVITHSNLFIKIILPMKYLKTTFIMLLVLSCSLVMAQKNTTYQTPPKVIADMIDAPQTPLVSISPNQETMLLLRRPGYPSIEEVGQEELRIAGVRINPKTNSSSRSSYFNGLALQSIATRSEKAIKDLPADPRIENVNWSPDGSMIAFTNTVAGGLELWVVNVANASAKKLTDAIVNNVTYGRPFNWLADNRTILYKSVLTKRGSIPQQQAVPTGPVIQANDGTEAPVRTYQDLLENPHDEALFEYFTSAQLMKLDVATGASTPFGTPGIIAGFSPSPDGNYVLVTTIKRPFSYLVPYSRFPQEVSIFDKNGKLIRMIADKPLAENVPKGFQAVEEGPRSFTWRNDAPATLHWVEAQDGGDPRREADIRDRMFYLEAPFTGESKEGISFELRYGGVTWGNDGLAIAYESWWYTRRAVTSQFKPGNPADGKAVIFDRSYEDRYNDPGNFETTRNQYGESVLLTANNGKTLFLTGTGASPEGNRPFIDEFDIATQETNRLWRSEAPYYEAPVQMMDPEKMTVITRRESEKMPPNYFIRNLKSDKLTQLTDFENPYKALEGVQKELVKYTRDDGVVLSGTLYLPAGYDKEKDGPLPTFMWAYPREYKSADAASQVTGSPYQFTGVSWGSPIFWVTQGYAVFNNFSMPIVGEGDEEPNETFVKQLRMNAEAAVNKLTDMGVSDPNRLAVGGHSYGAFMTANLLAHTDLFAAGVARSGAYNRTLTPFGFQSEQRTYWEAPEVYYAMSPFMHADKIKEPILLTHGQADNNSGTFPIQSERFYAALKGHGATTRLVMLPHESHGYRARESVLHTLWEMNTWLDKHVKNKGKGGDIKP